MTMLSLLVTIDNHIHNEIINNDIIIIYNTLLTNSEQTVWVLKFNLLVAMVKLRLGEMTQEGRLLHNLAVTVSTRVTISLDDIIVMSSYILLFHSPYDYQ